MSKDDTANLVSERGTMPDKQTIIDHHELAFDAADKANGSLYICEPRGQPGVIVTTALLAELRDAGLWSEEEPRSVPDEQREAYKEQLKLIDTSVYQQAGVEFLIARFDHPKYPSDGGRWDAWTAFFDSRFERL